MMTEDQMNRAKAFMAKNPDAGRRRLMAETGCTAFATTKFLKQWAAGATLLTKPVPPGPQAAPTPGSKPGVSVRDFLGRFDFESKLRRTVKDLCADRFVSDADIRNACDIPVSSFKTVASLPEFQACQLKESGTVWWSTKENIDTVRAKARKWGISK